MARPRTHRRQAEATGAGQLKYALGAYSRLVEIQAKPSAASNNEMNEDKREFATVAKRWARIVPLSGREFWQANQAMAATTHQVNLRGAYPGLKPDHRLKCGDRILAIESVRNLDDIGTENELMCIENVSGST